MKQLKPPAIQLGKISAVPPRQVFIGEEKVFTPWLASNIEELSNVIGLDIGVKETEAKVGAYELDIYAYDKDNPDTTVIIENQLETTDHKHLGQLMAYDAGLNAKVVIWISPEIRDEHRTTLNWLNQVSGGNVAFFLIRVEVIRIDNSLPAVRLEVEVEPSTFEQELESVKTSKAQPIAPKELAWNDSPNNSIPVMTWKSVYQKVLERAVQEGFDLQKVINLSTNSDDFRANVSIQSAGQTFYADAAASASALRRKASRILEALGKPSKFLRIECENGSIFELPE